jgi:hypothetical protein
MTLDDANFKQSGSDRSHQPHLQEGIRSSRDSTFSRREFVGMAAASLLMAGRLDGSASEERKNGIPYRTLGRTGEKVSVIGLGGYHLGKQSDPEDSIRIIRSGIDEGINFLDNCWDYNGGESEIRRARPCSEVIARKPF